MGRLTRFLMVGLSSVSAFTYADAPTEIERYLLSRGTEIVAKFDSNANGLTAIVAKTAAGEQQLFYVLGDSQLIAGQVFNASGVNLTEMDMARVAAMPDDAVPTHSSLSEGYEKAANLAYLTDGHAGRDVFALFDPECPYCHEFYTKSRASVEQGLITIKWLPVALLGNDTQRQASKRKIETLYKATDFNQAMVAMTQNRLPESELTQEVNVNLSRNLLFMRDLPSRRVPTVLFKDRTNQVIMYDGLNNERYEHMIGK